MIRIENINRNFGKLQLERLIRQLLINAGQADVPSAKKEGDFEKAINSKIVIDMDKQGKKTGQVWFQSTHRASVIEILKLHKKVWSGHIIRTYLMGFAYDDADGEEEFDDIKRDKEYLKMKDDLEDIVEGYIVDDEDEEEDLQH